jgi:hypothetical protein
MMPTLPRQARPALVDGRPVFYFAAVMMTSSGEQRGLDVDAGSFVLAAASFELEVRRLNAVPVALYHFANSQEREAFKAELTDEL